MGKTSSYHDSLIRSLADPVEAKLYLKAVLEDYPEGFLKALRNVAKANQMNKVAEAAGVKRETLYRALSDNGNPTLDTLTGVLAALGLRLDIKSLDEVEETVTPAAKDTNEMQPTPERIFIVQTHMYALPRYQQVQQETVGPLNCSINPVRQIAKSIPLVWNLETKNGYPKI